LIVGTVGCFGIGGIGGGEVVGFEVDGVDGGDVAVGVVDLVDVMADFDIDAECVDFCVESDAGVAPVDAPVDVVPVDALVDDFANSAAETADSLAVAPCTLDSNSLDYYSN